MPQSLKCPSCNAPLEIENEFAAIVKCDFCNVSSNLNAFGARQGVQMNFGGAGLLDQARKLKEIKQLALSGNKILAIKLYRETFGVDLKESKDGVEAIERGERVHFPQANRNEANRNPILPNYSAPAVVRGKRKKSFLPIFIILIISIFIGTIGAIYFITNVLNRIGKDPNEVRNLMPNRQLEKTTGENSEYAREILKFGGEGTGAGLFNDNRTIAVDQDGRIYSADFSGGRIQIFDEQGNFQTQIMSNTTKTVVALAVDRKENLYVLQGYDLFQFDLNNPHVSRKTRIDYASDIAVGLDGKIYVASRRKGITVLSPEGKILRTISTANTGLQDIRYLAVDGAGNFYALDGISFSVFKLSPEGKFLTRFGGRTSGSPDKTPPGLFRSAPDDIAIDGKGRVHVSQVTKISVFDSEGAFLEDFKTNQAFGMTFNDKDELFVATRPFITKHEIKNKGH